MLAGVVTTRWPWPGLLGSNLGGGCDIAEGNRCLPLAVVEVDVGLISGLMEKAVLGRVG